MELLRGDGVWRWCFSPSRQGNYAQEGATGAIPFPDEAASVGRSARPGTGRQGTNGARPPLDCREDDAMHNHPGHLSDSSREIAARYRSRAAATRRHAKRTGKLTLLSIAETYEHIAESMSGSKASGLLHRRTNRAGNATRSRAKLLGTPRSRRFRRGNMASGCGARRPSRPSHHRGLLAALAHQSAGHGELAQIAERAARCRADAYASRCKSFSAMSKRQAVAIGAYCNRRDQAC
jgi:hypothetical protein